MKITKSLNWTKSIVAFVLLTVTFSFSISAQNKSDAPLGNESVASLIKELKGVVMRLSPDKNEAKVVFGKWNKQKNLGKKSKGEVIELLFEDVKSVIKDSGTQYQIYSVFSFHKNIDVDENKPQAVLIDSFSYGNREGLMARIDNFTLDLQNNPSAKGYIVIKGKKNARLTAEKETKNYLKMRAFDMKNFVFSNENGNKTTEIELWRVPPGATLPEQEKTVKQNNSVETQIIVLEKKAWKEWKKGNKKFVENYLADDAFFVYSEGVINKSQVVEAIGSCKFNDYSLEDFRVMNLSDTSALVTYKANQDIICNGKSEPKAVRSTSVYVKRNGRWLSTFYTETAEVK